MIHQHERPAPRAASDLVRTVVSGLPEELRQLLPQHCPAVLREAILQECGQRTAGQLIARADRRWYTWGLAAAADTSTGGKGLNHPVGVAVRILSPYRCPSDGCSRECPDPRCEDGLVIDSGKACERCLEHRRDSHGRTGGSANSRPALRYSPGQRECVDCGRPVTGPAPDDGTCLPCTQAAIEALSSLARTP